jgi:hypothetical protein
MRHPRLLLPFLLLLTLLQGLSPLLHAHREAPQFVGAVHLHGALEVSLASADSRDPAQAGWRTASCTPFQGAIVTPVDEFERRAVLTVPAERPAQPVSLPQQAAPAHAPPHARPAPVASPHLTHRAPPPHAPPLS